MCNTNKKGRITSKIISNDQLATNVYEMIVECPDIVTFAKPGQFVNLYCHHQGRLLPRPISICEIDRDLGVLHLVYAILGDGTAEFSTYQAEDTIDVMGPFGNGFDTSYEGDDHLIVGGGVGTPPMVELAKTLKGEKTIVLGFRTEPYLVKRLAQYGEVFVATDDGSVGYKGHVVGLMEEQSLLGRIYACGPTPMLKGLQTYAKDKGLTASLSLEERMGCGFGACVGCVTKIKAATEIGFTYKKVCKDGPVFDAEEVLF